jgi:hypothetical protein
MTGWRKRQIADKRRYHYNKDFCNRMLMGLLGSEAMVEQWWQSQNLAFELKTPQEVFDLNDQGQLNVLNYLSEHCNGGYH